jgi:uncharacterized protein (DUF1697 family)
MALVVFLRGVNVGGHRKFRPAELAGDMAELGVVNVGAAGTFVVRGQVGVAAFRRELGKRLPFETDVMICPAGEILGLARSAPFSKRPAGRDVRGLVTVLARKPKALPKLPIRAPEGKDWQVELFRVAGRFALSFWRPDPRRQIYPNAVAEKSLGVPGTTRTWNTIEAVCRILGASPAG